MQEHRRPGKGVVPSSSGGAGPSEEAWARYGKLRRWFEEAGSVAVAYSGGTDSTFLLRIAHEVLGDRAVGIVATSASLPKQELEEALATARTIGARTEVIESRELDDPRYRENSPTRCFYCKSDLFSRVVAYAREHHLAAVVDGTNHDDLGDHRPGRRAAAETGVRSPLQELGFSKGEIRTLSCALGLPTWNKPAAPCLSSRIPYGTMVTEEILGTIERAEAAIRRLGIREFRVRHHEKIARIEVSPADFAIILRHRVEIARELKMLGYQYVVVDLEGFRSGRLNEEIER